MTTAQLAETMEVSRKTIRDTRKQVAMAQILAERAAFDKVLRFINRAKEEGVLQPLLYLEKVAFDETPLRTRVGCTPGIANSFSPNSSGQFW